MPFLLGILLLVFLFYSGHATAAKASWHRLDGVTAASIKHYSRPPPHTRLYIRPRPMPINFRLSPHCNRPKQQAPSIRETLNVFVFK